MEVQGLDKLEHAAAVDMLLALMAGREPERTAMVIPPRLVERGSVAGPGVAARTSA